MLQQLSKESAESNAALLAGHDDCARLQENSTLLSKQFSRAAMKAVDDQRGLLAATRTKLEAQQMTLIAVGDADPSPQTAQPGFERYHVSFDAPMSAKCGWNSYPVQPTGISSDF